MKYFLLIFLFLFVFVPPCFSMTLAWDSYSDPQANILRIWSSDNNVDWTILVADIPTDNVASEVSNGSDDTRVYYKMTAVNTDAEPDESSDDSNTISYYWTTGGGGHIGPAVPGGIHLIDCDKVQSGDADYDICQNRYNQ